MTPVVDTTGVVSKAKLLPWHSSTSFLEEHYEVIKELGKGNFGCVSLVRERATGETRVCKRINTLGMEPWLLDLQRREAELLATLDHSHVVRLYEYGEDTWRGQIVLILEYLPGGDLEKLVEKQGAVDEAFVARIVRQILVAVGYMHANGVVHRDIKPPNVMLTKARLEDDPHCKLIDFGLATRLDGPPRECAGSPGYLAPEVARMQQLGRPYFTPKADVWSVGISALHMLIGEVPFGGATDPAETVCQRIRAYKAFEDIGCDLRTLRESGVSEEAEDFLRWLLAEDPTGRPTAHEALEHPWLEKHTPRPATLAKEMLKGLESFCAASASERCCAFILASQTGSPDEDMMIAGRAFIDADADLDGQLSCDELTDLCERSQGWWGPGVNAEELLAAADLDQNGALSYTEFLAACSYAANRDGPASLLEAAFEAVDHDRDGMVSVQDVRKMLPEQAFPVLAALPKDRPFRLNEWRRCIRRCSRPSPVLQESPSFFSQLFCGRADSVERYEEITVSPIATY
eukprot:gnl/TRDRNA2_/TRDRNA2_181187_c0_seq1.p1 gnl/TRDRNA2_/TRDRNA2_181187_c0~~gnl/TRDRNA2_/TRDRNA2_181187_c0_seq1.p1  ORF type:complete len:518 (+),score=81.11 gnl/TRDRNA2_/TRDRNA2_181187_c0_seq1:58-1611(+)